MNNKLYIKDDEQAKHPLEHCPSVCLHIKEGSATPEIPMCITDQEGNELLCVHTEGKLMIGINITLPKTPIHIVIGEDEYTDEDIRWWAEGIQGWPKWHTSLLIRYLSQIVVDQILDKEPSA